MEGDYYDLDDILAGEETITVSWTSDQPELGYLAKRGSDNVV